MGVFLYIHIFFSFSRILGKFSGYGVGFGLSSYRHAFGFLFFFSPPARSENILLGHSKGERASEHSLVLAIYTHAPQAFIDFWAGAFLAVFWLYSRSREETGMGEKFSTCTAKVYVTN